MRLRVAQTILVLSKRGDKFNEFFFWGKYNFTKHLFSHNVIFYSLFYFSVFRGFGKTFSFHENIIYKWMKRILRMWWCEKSWNSFHFFSYQITDYLPCVVFPMFAYRKIKYIQKCWTKWGKFRHPFPNKMA